MPQTRRYTLRVDWPDASPEVLVTVSERDLKRSLGLLVTRLWRHTVTGMAPAIIEIRRVR
jgi:hypothetical protein